MKIYAPKDGFIDIQNNQGETIKLCTPTEIVQLLESIKRERPELLFKAGIDDLNREYREREWIL